MDLKIEKHLIPISWKHDDKNQNGDWWWIGPHVYISPTISKGISSYDGIDCTSGDLIDNSRSTLSNFYFHCNQRGGIFASLLCLENFRWQGVDINGSDTHKRKNFLTCELFPKQLCMSFVLETENDYERRLQIDTSRKE